MRTDSGAPGSHWIVTKNLSARGVLKWSRMPLRPLEGCSCLLLVTPQHLWSQGATQAPGRMQSFTVGNSSALMGLCCQRLLYVGLRMLRNQAGAGMEASFPRFSSSVRQAADSSATGLTGKAKCASCAVVTSQYQGSTDFLTSLQACPTGGNSYLLLPSWSNSFGWGCHAPQRESCCYFSVKQT